MEISWRNIWLKFDAIGMTLQLYVIRQTITPQCSFGKRNHLDQSVYLLKELSAFARGYLINCKEKSGPISLRVVFKVLTFWITENSHKICMLLTILGKLKLRILRVSSVLPYLFDFCPDLPKIKEMCTYSVWCIGFLIFAET